MKGLVILLFIVSWGQVQEKGKHYGEQIDAEGAKPVSTLLATMADHSSIETKLIGEVSQVCQKKGCWMKITINDETQMRVRFKDYGFFVPMDIQGSTAIIQGTAYWDTTSVEMLRHYAEDAGESSQEIEKIIEPQLDLAFEASGVIIR